MRLPVLLILWTLTIGTLATVESTPKGITKSEVNRKQSHKLGVNILDEEDNQPSLKSSKDAYSSAGSDSDNDDEEEQTSYHSFVMAVSMILVSEIGDKTFLIAALMAMRYNRWVVFAAAFSSLAVMTLLSGLVGRALPSLISQRLTQFLASMLFVIFGFKLLKEGLSMSKDLGIDEELAEVEEEIASSKLNESMDIESGSRTQMSNSTKINQVWYQKLAENVENLASFVLSPVFIQVFVMTFLGEWGDRSQIATIAMAAGSEYWIVILGATIGHGICTATACIGGKLLAKKISIRTVTLGGSAAFFVFAVLYMYDAYYHDDV